MRISKGSLITIRSLYPSLARSHKRIADAILEDPRQIIDLPVTELAGKAQVSEASVVLFCKKLGFNGYHDLKISLAEEVFDSSSDIHEEIESGDDTPVIIKKVFNTSIQALNDSLKILESSAVDRAAAAILEARRILLIGVGTSGIIAKDFWTRLYRVNLNANYFDNQTSMKMATAVVGQEDLVFAISHSGSTTGVISSLQAAREQGARTIGLTNYLNSPLAHVADILLLTSSRESGIREEEMTARIAQLAVMDAVFVTLANRSYERSSSYLKKTRAAVSGDKI